MWGCSRWSAFPFLHKKHAVRTSIGGEEVIVAQTPAFSPDYLRYSHSGKLAQESLGAAVFHFVSPK